MTTTNTQPKTYRSAMILIVGLFLMWGIANSLNDVLVAQFRKAFELEDFQSGLVQSAFLDRLLHLLDSRVVIHVALRISSRDHVGSLLYAAGAFLFYPAAELQRYGYFLAALLRDRKRPCVPRDVSESADDGLGAR